MASWLSRLSVKSVLLYYETCSLGGRVVIYVSEGSGTFQSSMQNGLSGDFRILFQKP